MKTIFLSSIIIIFAILHPNSSLLAPPNPIYEIVAKAEPKKCYTCEKDCSSPILQTCDHTSQCFSKFAITSDNTSIETKGCVETYLADTLCKDTQSCYTCNSDFCNKNTKELEDKGVSKCYVCIDECEKPAAQHDCEEVLTVVEGRPVKAACIWYEVTTEERVSVSKGCLMDDPVIRQTCLAANTYYPQIKCTICDTDLCNGEKEVEEKIVEECYYCDLSCKNPMERQKCEDVLGEGAHSRCIAMEFDKDGNNIESRRCVEMNDQTQNECDQINQNGGNCTICDTNLCNGKHTNRGNSRTERMYFIIHTLLTIAVLMQSV